LSEPPAPQVGPLLFQQDLDKLGTHDLFLLGVLQKDWQKTDEDLFQVKLGKNQGIHLKRIYIQRCQNGIPTADFLTVAEVRPSATRPSARGSSQCRHPRRPVNTTREFRWDVPEYWSPATADGSEIHLTS